MEKVDMFFLDIGLIPIIIHENILDSINKSTSLANIIKLCRTVDFMSDGDCIQKRIICNKDYELLENYAMSGAVLPCEMAAGHLKYVKFPT